jgi:hypothetical protein
MTWFSGTKPSFRSLGVLSGKIKGSLRATIDRLTPTPLETKKSSAKSPELVAARTMSEAVNESSAGRAKFLRQQIEQIRKAK